MKIDYYVISLKGRDDRIQNIKNQQQKINTTINVFEAVNGDEIDMNNVSNQIVADSFKEDSKHRKREIGCFLSHYYILKLIESNNSSDGYTVIFEDDFDIIIDDFHKKIKNTLESMSQYEFDLLYIETLSNNIGEPLIKDVCNIDWNKDFYGTQAYIVKNSSIARLLEATWIVDRPIDHKYTNAIRTNKIKAYTFCQFLTKSIDSESTLF
jgi:GR25 family glycosyltransferase involved in LPS biosynthesis